MIYHSYQAQAQLIEPWSELARVVASSVDQLLPGPMKSYPLRNLAAGLAVFAGARLTHQRPSFGIDTVRIGNREVEVREEAADATPFCTLLHLRKDSDIAQPPVLVVAPMSGHFATLLRGTVRTLLVEHDVYITDWHNARDVPLAKGRFELDDFAAHIIRFLEFLGPRSHLLAVCQPCVAALVATAVMAEAGNRAAPASLTLMAGPIDTRVNPTAVNKFATSRPIEWFEQKLIALVPFRFAGRMRRVYPGFLQLAGFMSMNLDRHVKAHNQLYNTLLQRDAARAAAIRDFYDEYFAVMDLPAEFYLETVRQVFQEHTLPRGRMTYRGRPIDFGAIRRTMLLTVEGEKDDICSVGQTLAAQELCTGIHPYRKMHHIQTGVGHYGVFNGRRWVGGVYPKVREVIHLSGG
jgi:poly(3-hydroxybutyrate) depolymerase